jgi:hypothetical protein
MSYRWRRRRRRIKRNPIECPYGTCDHLAMEHQGTECLHIDDDGIKCPCPIAQRLLP